MDPISKEFVASLEEFARREKIPVIHFRKGQRKDGIAAEQRKKFGEAEGVVFIGKAQEKTPVFRTERLYDNTRIAVKEIAGDGDRKTTEAFSGLQSHYMGPSFVTPH